MEAAEKTEPKAAEGEEELEPVEEIRPIRCPYSNECGYKGVWLHQTLFDEHMRKFHPSHQRA